LWGSARKRRTSVGSAAIETERVQMGYDKTRLIAILDQLADEGLIWRTADPEDRRARIVQLTAAGHARQRQVRADIGAMESAVLDGFSDGEQTVLRTVLARLAGRPGPTG
jgi:DNA-binding MarR family transcriptional regulator